MLRLLPQTTMSRSSPERRGERSPAIWGMGPQPMLPPVISSSRPRLHAQPAAEVRPVGRRGELRPHGDPRGKDPLRRYARGGELLQQGFVGDEKAVCVQLAHAGAAGVVRGEEAGGQAQLPPAAQLRDHHGREDVDADHGVRPQGLDPPPRRGAPLTICR